MSGSRQADPRRSRRDGRERALVATLALLTCVTAVVSSLGAPLVPAAAAAYGTGLATAQWVVTAAMLAGAVATPLVGRLGGGLGRRPTVLVTLALVTLGCAVSAWSAAVDASFGWMGAGRALQGIGMALTPVAIAVARDEVPGPRMPSTVALLSVTTVAGVGLGYPLTGLVVDHGGLPTAYAIGAALTGATLLLCLTVLPSRVGPGAGRLDWSGAGLLSVGLLAVLLAVTRGGSWGWSSAPVLVLAAAGTACLCGWVPWTLRRDRPLVDLRLAARRGVLAPHVTALVAGVGMYFLLSLAMVVAQADDTDGWGLGRSVAVASLLLVPYSVSSVLGSRVALLLGRRRPHVLLPTGCVMFLGSTLAMAAAHHELWHLAASMAVGGLGSGFTFSSLPLLLIPHVPESETSSALAVNQLLRFTGMAVGSAVCVVLMAALGDGPAQGEAGFRNALLVMSGVWVLLVAGLALARTRGRPAVPGQEVDVVLGPGADR
ncbi:MFS family permease [Nocardioides cavernae]|uniref:MFS family permease n=1 Tax=Nocardioides cavernae TaxID=1921566 RepID=A0A7Y9H1A6_9ACTN|nr:MFS transporter [Nocardioides cavernae]NYE35806.1 MFS family permease [Nocardioides cavernae]